MVRLEVDVSTGARRGFVYGMKLLPKPPEGNIRGIGTGGREMM